ncbi:hypothetical protein [Vacuolonema iberomarrocanum]|uniref:hypothetical protein n=1 Tax=Vacuolonema iberomarrocanum TaxID=3454632 RepID=UPI003F6E30A8
MNRNPKPTDRQTVNPSHHSNNHPSNTHRRSKSRSSRVMTVFGLGSLVAIIAAVSLTSERDGPGSQSLTASISAASTSASGCVATETMPGGDNFYVPNAPLVEDLGSDLIVEGTVREAGTCEPVRDARIQIWLNTARGGEGEPSNRGSVMTDENGFYRLETSPVVSQFGQPHVHIAYDDGDYRSLFLRSVMESEDVSSFTVDFVLEPVDE